jgi:hypothetical protein
MLGTGIIERKKGIKCAMYVKGYRNRALATLRRNNNIPDINTMVGIQEKRRCDDERQGAAKLVK